MAATSKKASKKSGKKTAAKKAATSKAVGKKTARRKTSKVAAKKSGKAPARSAASGNKAGARKTTTRSGGKKATRTTGTRSTPKPAARTGAPRIQTAHSVIPGIAPYQPRKGEEYMNEAQRKHFRGILLAWRNQLVSDITRTISSMQDESINHPDPTDRATQETDMSLELRNRDRERKLIKKIDDTIQRIDEDDYGFCDNCGVEIGIARLEARPTATLCIDCKTLAEIRERQMV